MLISAMPTNSFPMGGMATTPVPGMVSGSGMFGSAMPLGPNLMASPSMMGGGSMMGGSMMGMGMPQQMNVGFPQMMGGGSMMGVPMMANSFPFSNTGSMMGGGMMMGGMGNSIMGFPTFSSPFPFNANPGMMGMGGGMTGMGGFPSMSGFSGISGMGSPLSINLNLGGIPGMQSPMGGFNPMMMQASPFGMQQPFQTANSFPMMTAGASGQPTYIINNFYPPQAQQAQQAQSQAPLYVINNFYGTMPGSIPGMPGGGGSPFPNSPAPDFSMGGGSPFMGQQPPQMMGGGSPFMGQQPPQQMMGGGSPFMGQQPPQQMMGGGSPFMGPQQPRMMQPVQNFRPPVQQGIPMQGPPVVQRPTEQQLALAREARERQSMQLERLMSMMMQLLMVFTSSVTSRAGNLSPDRTTNMVAPNPSAAMPTRSMVMPMGNGAPEDDMQAMFDRIPEMMNSLSGASSQPDPGNWAF
jgi:hypothetical protein